MDHRKIRPMASCHVVAVPFPGRGHINPMMCPCHFLASRRSEDVLVPFVVTEEWFGFIGSEPKPDNIRFACIPNVIPSEIGRGADQPGFYEVVLRNMRAPVEKLLDDQLLTPATAIIADTWCGRPTLGIRGIFRWPRFGPHRRRSTRCSITLTSLFKTGISPLTSTVRTYVAYFNFNVCIFILFFTFLMEIVSTCLNLCLLTRFLGKPLRRTCLCLRRK